MTEFLTFDTNSAYSEIKERAQAEGVTSKDFRDNYVEEYINEKIGIGELHPDSNNEECIVNLKARWDVYKENINIS
jgi:hypothetical protein